MKVCIISSIFPPYARGGAEAVAQACAQACAPDHDVVVITCAPWTGGASLAGRWEKVGRMRIFRFTPLNLFTIFAIAKYPALLRLMWHAVDMCNLHTYLVVRRILLQEKPDLILTHNLKGLGYSVHLAIHHSRFVQSGAKWFHTVHDMGALHPTGVRLWGKEHALGARNPLVLLYAWINKKLLGDPDIVISPSQFLLDEYRKAGFFSKSRMEVVRNPVVLSMPSTSSGNKTLFPERSRAESKGFRFLYLGQLEPYKGIKLLLEAWREFSGTHPNAMLTIVGEGSMRQEVAEAAKRLARVEYRGAVPHEAIGSLFGAAHCTVIPSLAYENAPTAIGESFTFGVPVIASRIGGIPELVKDGVDGFLFAPGTSSSLVHAMEQALASPWEKLSRAALTHASMFSLASYRAKLDELCGMQLS